MLQNGPPWLISQERKRVPWIRKVRRFAKISSWFGLRPGFHRIFHSKNAFAPCIVLTFAWSGTPNHSWRIMNENKPAFHTVTKCTSDIRSSSSSLRKNTRTSSLYLLMAMLYTLMKRLIRWRIQSSLERLPIPRLYKLTGAKLLSRFKSSTEMLITTSSLRIWRREITRSRICLIWLCRGRHQGLFSLGLTRGAVFWWRKWMVRYLNDWKLIVS